MSLQTDYDSFNKYRGDMEQRRVETDDKFIADRNEKRQDLMASGLKPGSREYNKKMEVVDASYKREVTAMDRDTNNLNKTDAAKNLQKFYEESTTFDDTQKEFLSQEDFDKVRPSFNEFVTGEFGTQQQQTAFAENQDRRITTSRGIR